MHRGAWRDQKSSKWRIFCCAKSANSPWEYGLSVSLGQTDAGCQTLAQVLSFAGSDYSLEAEKMISELQCP